MVSPRARSQAGSSSVPVVSVKIAYVMSVGRGEGTHRNPV